MSTKRALNNAARSPDTEERAEAWRGARIRFARWTVTERAAEAREADKRLDHVSLACACGRVRFPRPHKTLIFLSSRRPALWERILGNWRPMPKSLMQDDTEGWRLHGATDNSSFREYCRREEDSFTRRDVYVYPSSHSADLSLWAVVFCTCRQVSS